MGRLCGLSCFAALACWLASLARWRSRTAGRAAAPSAGESSSSQCTRQLRDCAPPRERCQPGRRSSCAGTRRGGFTAWHPGWSARRSRTADGGLHLLRCRWAPWCRHPAPSCIEALTVKGGRGERMRPVGRTFCQPRGGHSVNQDHRPAPALPFGGRPIRGASRMGGAGISQTPPILTAPRTRPWAHSARHPDTEIPSTVAACRTFINGGIFMPKV